jgi:hypothetical protein
MTAPVLDQLTTQPITVGGRTFRPSASTTFKQDIFVMSLVTEAGLEDIAAKFKEGNFDIDEVAQKIIITAFTRGKLFELLGAVMEEEGTDWTIERAKANAEFFANLRSTEDKLALRGSIVAVILGFFVSGLLASRNSTISLTSEQSYDRNGVIVPSVAPTPSPEATSTSVTGTASSENSPTSTSPATPASSGGR